jgi:hypothetical protein
MPDPTMGDVFRAIRRIRRETPDMAWLLDVPSVAPLLIKRAAGQIDDQAFRYQLYKTRWWKTHSDAQRQWGTLVSIDPAKARRQRQQMTLTVSQLANQMGIDIPARGYRSGGKGPGGYRAQGGSGAAKIADLALYNGWDEEQITKYLLSFATWGEEGQSPTGGIATGMTQIRKLAEQYGVDPRDRRLFGWSKNVLAGTDTLEGVEERLRARAVARYGENEEIKGVLERGGTVEDWFSEYRRMISEELEVPEAEISVTSPRWQEILMHRGDDGRVRPMGHEEARRHIRTRAEWNDTTRAKEMEAGMAKNLLEVFGKRAG